MESRDFEEIEAETAEVEADEPIEHECPYCGKTYKTEKGLMGHMEKCDGNPKNATEEEESAWEPEACPTCGKVFKTELGYHKHVERGTCEPKGEKKERVAMTDEEKAEKRKEYVRRWVEKNVTIQIRLGKESEELEFVNERVAELQEEDESAGMATYFRALLEADMKKHARKAAREAKE